MSKPPFDKLLHGSMHFAEGGMKAFGHFRPTHPLRLVRKKWAMLERGSFFAFAPRNVSGEDAVVFARTSAHFGCDIFVNEEDENVPKGNEFEAAGVAFGNVGVTFFAAFWSEGSAIFTRNDFDIDVLNVVSCFL